MAQKGFRLNFPPLKILSESQIEEIHKSALSVLEETGVTMDHNDALKLLGESGCIVRYEAQRVKFPASLVEECLRTCPRTFRVRARNPENDVIIGGNSVCFGTSPGMDTVALDTWEPRRPTRKEFYDTALLTDALDNPQITLNYFPWFGFEGLPPVMCIPEGFAARIRNTSKPLSTAYSKDSEIFTIQMAQAVDAEAFFCPYPSPPLTFFQDSIDGLYRALDAGFPIRVGGGETMGATSPVTVAGSLVTTIATMLAALVLVQLIKPGSRVAAHSGARAMHMQTGLIDFGNIQESLHKAGLVQYWRTKGIPVKQITGFTNSKRMDIQCGYERTIMTLIAALSGANVVQLAGCIYGELTLHPLQIIIDDDIANMVGRFIEGIDVNEETLAVDLINTVGPIPGMYLDKAHTRKYWRNEGFIPKVADRFDIARWREGGKKSVLDYAQEKMEAIISSHEPYPLTPGQEADISRILEEAWTYYRKRDMLE